MRRASCSTRVDARPYRQGRRVRVPLPLPPEPQAEGGHGAAQREQPMYFFRRLIEIDSPPPARGTALRTRALPLVLRCTSHGRPRVDGTTRGSLRSEVVHVLLEDAARDHRADRRGLQGVRSASCRYRGTLARAVSSLIPPSTALLRRRTSFRRRTPAFQLVSCVRRWRTASSVQTRCPLSDALALSSRPLGVREATLFISRSSRR
jgi:hypothetical protein